VLSSSALYRVRGGRSTKLADQVGCALRLSPDARWIATVCPGPKNVIRLIRLGQPMSFGHVIGRGIEAARSPDGRRLAVHGPAGISVYDLRTRRTRVLARDAALAASPDYWYAASLGLAWSPDGRSIAYIVGALNGPDRRDIRSGDLRVVTLAGRARTIANLVLALPGHLRDYDVRTGELLHTWTMPNVQTGLDCDFHCGPRPTCLASCPAYPLVLEDAARGLVAYVFDGRVHVLRIADGADAVVAGGSMARFVDSGLVYADGSRISFVPFAELPLLAFR
jgi:hypothetical protein